MVSTKPVTLDHKHNHQTIRSTVTSILLLSCISASAGSLADSDSATYRSSEGPSYDPAQFSAEISAATSVDPTAILANSSRMNQPEARNEDFLSWTNDDAWITDIGTLLFTDADRDGYFSSFSLTIDADTRYSETDVYAVIDIQNSYSERERLHTTSVFSLYGSSYSDEYRIDIDLVSSYPVGDYDVFIDLVDAYEHRILDSVSAEHFRNLSALPLESEDLDLNAHIPEDAVPFTSVPNGNINTVEHAGSSGILMSLLLGVAVAARRRFTQ